MGKKDSGRVFVLSHKSRAQFITEQGNIKLFRIQTTYTYESNCFPKYMWEVLKDPKFFGIKQKELDEIFNEFKQNGTFKMSSGEEFKAVVTANYVIRVTMTIDNELYSPHRRRQCASQAYKFYRALRNEIREIYKQSYKALNISSIEDARTQAKRGGRFSSISFLNAVPLKNKNPAAVAA